MLATVGESPLLGLGAVGGRFPSVKDDLGEESAVVSVPPAAADKRDLRKSRAVVRLL